MSVLFCPLDIPRIEPADWNEWWHTWDKSMVMPKVIQNHNEKALDWLGLDLYVRPGYPTQYHAPLAEQNPTVKGICQQVIDYMNYKVTRIRVIENLVPILPHSDNAFPFPNVRTFLWNNYPRPVWKFRRGEVERELVMPETTNSFYYLDGVITHESIYDPTYSKGVLAIYGTADTGFKDMIRRSIIKYPEYGWEISGALI